MPILSTPNECINYPIILAYDHSHFCPLQTSDSSTETTLDNLLPLYLSINHMSDQILLPIRFLGDDVSADRSDTLLRDYLRIRTVKNNYDSTSPPKSILCAELNDKHLSTRNDFYVLYHKYLINFFQVQKPNAIEEERQRERRRELDNYAARPTSYDPYTQSILRREPLPSSYSPMTSPRSNTTINSNQNRYPDDHRYDNVYNDGAYIPPNGPVYLENLQNQMQQSTRSPDYRKTAQQDSNGTRSSYDSFKQPYSTTYLDNINNLSSNGRPIDTLNIGRRDNASSPIRGNSL